MTPEKPIPPDSLPEQHLPEAPTSLPEGNRQATRDVPATVEYSALPGAFDEIPTTLPEEARVREIDIGSTQEVGTATLIPSIPGQPAGPRTIANARDPILDRMSNDFVRAKQGEIGQTTLFKQIRRVAHRLRLYPRDPQETMKFDDGE